MVKRHDDHLQALRKLKPDFKNPKVVTESTEQTTVAISPENSSLTCSHKLPEHFKDFEV